MTVELKQNLALAKQHFEDLIALTTIDALVKQQYGQGPKRQRTKELVAKLVSIFKDVEDAFSEHLETSDDAPFMHLGVGLRNFYTNLLEPNANKLREILLDMSGLNEMLGVNGWEEFLKRQRWIGKS